MIDRRESGQWIMKRLSTLRILVGLHTRNRCCSGFIFKGIFKCKGAVWKLKDHSALEGVYIGYAESSVFLLGLLGLFDRLVCQQCNVF